VQVDPIKPSLKAPGTKRLKLIYDGPLSNFTFKFNLHRYTMAKLSECGARFRPHNGVMINDHIILRHVNDFSKK